ncbi:MAG: glycoside hydrolase TIM-barrel-like domain-containing protein [bacterium]
MATILLSSVGAAIGSGFGGTVLGLSGAVIGRAVGATAGRAIDQNLLQNGSQTIETGKIERFRIPAVGYGTPVQEVWGRMRIAGQVIWASRFLESSQSSGGGKGTRQPSTTAYSYSVSLAIGLCIGVASSVGRVWADGIEIAKDSLDLRFYPGSETQLPDAKIEAVEGAGNAPSYRGIAYVVIEELQLARFGNRVPAFSFEVIRRANISNPADRADIANSVKAVAMIPGSGEYALATSSEFFKLAPGKNQPANVHSISGQSDFDASLSQLRDELPNCGSISLVVCWFGDDLRCGECAIQPKVEQSEIDGERMPWTVSGLTRSQAAIVPRIDGNPVYGGTPTDQSVIQAIQRIRSAGLEVMFYPFILMDQLAGNSLPNPWSDESGQPKLPWRGRITTSIAPGRSGSPDKTAVAEAEARSFFGEAGPGDFMQSDQTVDYTGSDDWGYRRFILHYANLCALAGGVDAFCIGSELVGVTQIQSAQNVFPAVLALQQLAGEVRSILGNGTKISYAADWTEYRGLQRDGDFQFNMDPLWSDPNIDFIGIDNYMPLSDWRTGADNADSTYGSNYNPDYLTYNIAGGEGFDWFYETEEAASFQFRSAIRDLEYDENWIYRPKDILNWWRNDHHDRISGVRSAEGTGWSPQMKPIRFTEYGCAAINLGTNEPNKFLDPNSSESSLPRGSNGQRDDYVQSQYLAAMAKYWNLPQNNPVSTVYSGPMVEFDRAHAWAWDSRPFPEFPGNSVLWADSGNYFKGHWLNGRATNQPLFSVVTEICEAANLSGVPSFRNFNNTVHGFAIESTKSAREKLQMLSIAFGFDIGETEGSLVFFKKTGVADQVVKVSDLVFQSATNLGLVNARSSDAEIPDRSSLTYIEAESDFAAKVTEASQPSIGFAGELSTEVSILMTEEEARATAERLLNEAFLARDSVQFALPLASIGANLGDALTLGNHNFRIVGIEDTSFLAIEAVRVDESSYLPAGESGTAPVRPAIQAATPVFAVFLDLPLLQSNDDPNAPHVAVTSTPWQGTVGIWSSPSQSGFTLNTTVERAATIGVTLTELQSAPACLWDRGSRIRLRMSAGTLASASPLDILNGANVVAIGDGTSENWEVFQFGNAELVEEDTYELSLLLRGLVGTDAVAPDSWPVGSLVILLNSSVLQINLPSASRGLERNYLIAVAENGYSGPDAVAIQTAFNGIGLRPIL